MDKYIEYFEQYISSFNLSDANLQRKKEHTYRVMRFCDLIAKDLNLKKEDIFIANLIGLLHDIGRFQQYKKYKKFNDWETFDHASYGVEVLQDLKILNNVKEKELILKAIEDHNKIKIEENLTEREKLFCNIIRDADKLDILNLIIEDKIKMKPYDEQYSMDAIDTILKGECIDLKKYTKKVDQSLVKIGLVNNIIFPFSKKYILENNIVDKLIEIYEENNKKEKKNLEKIKLVLKERLGN